MKQFTEKSSGSAIEMHPGEEFEVALPETRTAGYRWTLRSTNKLVCDLLNESAHPCTGAVGGSGTHSWHFRADAPGNCSITMDYKRAWQDSAQPTRTFNLQVRVGP